MDQNISMLPIFIFISLRITSWSRTFLGTFVGHMKHPILFIHGFAGGSYEFKPIIRYLKSHDDPVCYEFVYKKKFGQVSLKVIAQELHEFIITHVPEPELDIVAISQGGVIARYYIAHYQDRKIRKCITLCSPHHGSLLAYIGILPGIKELQPHNSFLKKLDVKKAEYYAVYNPADLMVFPGWFAKFREAKENKRVLSLLHPLTFSNQATLKFIYNTLSN